MKINIAKSSGFCFGVKRAIEVAQQTAKSQNNVYMLGDIVHNEEVAEDIKKAGIKKIKRLAQGKNKTFLIRAHGACAQTIQQAKSLGYRIVDATCPMVKEIHHLAQNAESKGCRIIVIGDRKHDEVQGIIGQLKQKALVIDVYKPIPVKTVQKINQAAVVVQSTQNMEKVLDIVWVLKQYIKEVKFFNTICQPTRRKQAEIKILPLKNEVMIIIGSKTSANTKRLYEISHSLNKHSYWVQSKKDLQPKWFKNVQTVGIMAGASTPDATTQAVFKQIRNYS